MLPVIVSLYEFVLYEKSFLDIKKYAKICEHYT